MGKRSVRGWVSEHGWPIAWTGAVAGALVVLLFAGRFVADAHLRAAAERSALGYAELIAAAVPDLGALLHNGTPSPAALGQLARLRRLGSVFRFKLFGTDGSLLLTSDQLDLPDLGRDGSRLGHDHGRHKAEAARVIDSGVAFVELKDGRGREDLPDRYSEAYVPVLVDGKSVGVVEVYVDQSALAQEIVRVLVRNGAAVLVVLLLLGALGTLQRRANRRVRYLARHDALSGALNRASFGDVLREAERNHTLGGGGFAVLCVDLDRFKEVNDSLGHAAGDEVLRRCTDRLRALLHDGDRLARLGGDEFAMLQVDVAGPADVRRLAERVVASLAEPYEIDGHRVRCGGSVGAAIFGVDAKELPELMHRADLALYRVKRCGRGGFNVYDADLDSRLWERRTLAADLSRAIEEQRLALRYEKRFAADGKTVGGEAVLHWHHPERGCIPADVFIPIAEEGDMIGRLGEWILREACHEASGWPEEQSVAVRLPAALFRQDDLVATVREALARAELAASRLELEVTESLLLGDADRVIRVLDALAALGVRITMGDIGNEHSSFHYLWRLPFDKLTIGTPLTRALQDDAEADRFVRSIVSLAHSLGVRVNAEGVETEEQLAALTRHGCDELQGTLLARPARGETPRRPEDPSPATNARSSEPRPERSTPAGGDPSWDDDSLAA